MDCKRPECLKEWREMVADEQENKQSYANGGYMFVHCEMEGCHTLYWKGKNGSTCEWCETEACESCADAGRWDDDYEEFYCSEECFKEHRAL